MKFWVVFLLADVALGVSLNENEMQKWVDNNIEIAQFVEQNRAEFGRIVAGINQASFLSTLVSWKTFSKLLPSFILTTAFDEIFGNWTR